MKRNLYLSITVCVLFVFVALSGCKSPEKVATVPVETAKSQKDFFSSMMDQAFEYRTFSARLNVDLKLPGKEFSSRVDLKMIRDSAFQLSVQPFLGIEVARIELSKDSVKVVDRINRRYVAENYEKLRGETPIAFNFYNLQALFTNRIFIPGEQDISPAQYNRFRLTQEGSVAEIRIKDAMNLLYTFLADGEEKFLSAYITDESEKYALQWEYKDFRIHDGQLFPMLMDVNVLHEGFSQGGMTLSFSRLQVNPSLNLDFPVPDKYNRITFAEIVKSLSSQK